MSINLHKLYGETKKRKNKKEGKHAELHAHAVKH